MQIAEEHPNGLDCVHIFIIYRSVPITINKVTCLEQIAPEKIQYYIVSIMYR